MAVDANDQVLTISVPAHGAARLEAVNLGQGNTVLGGVSCLPSSGCTAVDDGGRELSSTTPSNPQSWVLRHTGAASFNKLSCTPALCLADGGSSVTVLRSGVAPRSFVIGPADVYQGPGQVSCTNAGLCIVADSEGGVHVSTNPAAGSWQTTLLGDAPQCEKVACSYDGISSVSCATPELCLATDGHSVWTTTNPWGEVAAWQRSPAPDAAGIEVISCPSVRMCVGISPGAAFVTRDPADKAPQWNKTPLPAVPSAGAWQSDLERPSGLSCPTEQACVAIDSLGYSFAGNPSGGPWTAQKLDYAGNSPPSLTGVSCEPTGACAAVDGEGRAFVGTFTNP